MISNEQAVCEKVISLFEERLGAARSEVTRPEKDGSGPPVELRLRIGAMRLAIEHTRIEPFEQHIASAFEFGKFSASLKEALDGAMPGPGTWKLFFDLSPTKDKAKSEHHLLRGKITAWVQAAAAELLAEAPARRSKEWAPYGDKGVRQGAVDGVRVMLTRHVSWSQSGKHDGRLLLARELPKGSNIEEMREARIERALNDKCPKLMDCVALGDESVLVLEMDDFQLSNDLLVAEAVRECLAKRNDGPTHLFIADTTIEGSWDLIQLVDHGVFVFDGEEV